MSKLSFRSVFISDVHLGYRSCQARYLLDFLDSMRCEHLYLVGDIVDLENLAVAPYWNADHGAVVARILAIAARGTRVTYIPGNHDAPLRVLAGQRISGVEFALAATHRCADGRIFRVSHGDEFDGGSDAPAWLLRLGDRLQGFICALNRGCNALRRRLGLRYAPISIALKRGIPTAARFIDDFESRIAQRAADDGFDGHICGHIHYANLRESGGALYVTDGDWVEHCTALVEHHDGALELLHWTEQRRTLAHRAAIALPEPMPLPAAA